MATRKKAVYQVRYWANGGGFLYSPVYDSFARAIKRAQKLPSQFDWVVEENGKDKFFNPAAIFNSNLY